MPSPTTCVFYDGDKNAHAVTDLSTISEVLKNPWAFVWFDIVAPQEHDMELLQEEFNLHPLAIEDAVQSHQRSKIESYEDYWFLVVHGVLEEKRSISVHEIAIFAGRRFLITVRSEPPYPLDEIERRWDHQPETLERNSGALLYAILDTLVDGYWPAAEMLEERVNALETTLFEEGVRTRKALIEIFAVKKTIQQFRRAVLPMREILIAVQRNDLNVIQPAELPYFRDIYDHATRVNEEIDSARDLTNSALEIHLGLTANQQNEVAKQLTIIATIFLPLTYLTGFFGQNFGFLVNRIGTRTDFIVYGLALEAFALAVLLLYFKRRHWF